MSRFIVANMISGCIFLSLELSFLGCSGKMPGSSLLNMFYPDSASERVINKPNGNNSLTCKLIALVFRISQEPSHCKQWSLWMQKLTKSWVFSNLATLHFVGTEVPLWFVKTGSSCTLLLRKLLYSTLMPPCQPLGSCCASGTRATAHVHPCSGSNPKNELS